MNMQLPATVPKVLVLGGIGVFALVFSAIGAYAGHKFSDVPNSHPFHAEIGWVAEKEIAKGFSDGTYKPANAVTRQAMAAFLQRLGTGIPMETEPNDSFAAADHYPPAGPAMGGIIGVPEDSLASSDYWRFSHPGGDLVAETIATPCSDHLRGDTVLTLFDANGVHVDENDDNGDPGSYCSRVVGNNLPAGDYFLRVRGFTWMRHVPWYALVIWADGVPLGASAQPAGAPTALEKSKP